MSDKKITYLLGAGASYQACPILNELGDKMIEMAKVHLDAKYNDSSYFIKNISRNHKENILQDIGYFGRKAIEYGTIDTYAKKLSLNEDLSDELQRLKLALSIFFVLWETSEDSIKNRKNNDSKDFYQLKTIDARYLALLATFLEKGDYYPRLNNRVSFVSWNYDLQLQKAFMSFFPDESNINFKKINKYFPYRLNNTNQKMDLLHLNGYSGFYYLNDERNNDEEHSILDRTNSKKTEDIIEKINFSFEAVNSSQIRVNDHINYAWEANRLAEKTREVAKSIFSESDIIVVIGYSFPPFNRRIDQMLFDELKGRRTKIYYQDPNASEDLIKTFIEPNNCEVITIKDNVKHFFVPFEY